MPKAELIEWCLTLLEAGLARIKDGKFEVRSLKSTILRWQKRENGNKTDSN